MAGKSAQAFRTIGELADELGVPQHILRYWETRFPQLRPLQRAGNRRYYRPEDVALAKRIHGLLDQEGYTIRGVQRVLGGKGEAPEPEPQPYTAAVSTGTPPRQLASADPGRLRIIRDSLAAALADSA